MLKDSIIIFTDGASRGNPGAGGWAAIIAKSLGGDGRPDITELGGFEKNTTNNQMELRAAIEGLRHISNFKSNIEIFTDSSYLINGITKWLSGWRMNDWKTKGKKKVLNQKLWEELAGLTENKNIEWKYLGGHSGIAGNERCDEIATKFAGGMRPVLFSGSLSEYKIDILNFDLDETKAKQKTAARSHSRAAAYSYVSLLDGKIQIHKTWAECEARVKGKSGTRFKKAKTLAEEKEIIKEFSE